MQTTITNTFHNLPDEMKDLKQWILWKLEEKTDKQGNVKYDKVPKQVNGYNASPTNQYHYTTFTEAITAYETGRFSGIGFALVESDPYTIIDLDDCFNENGQLTKETKIIVDSLNSYTEISQSGNGLHIVVKSDNIEGFNNQEENVEMYSEKRFFAMTGNVFEDLITVEENNMTVQFLHDRYKTKSKTITNEVVEDEPEKFSDDELLEKIRNSNQGKKFSTLYDDGDISDYPSNSEADIALLNILSWWTKNSIQIARIARNSALYRPEKWDKPSRGKDHLYWEIQEALNFNLGKGYMINGNYQFNLNVKEEIAKGSWWYTDGDKSAFLHDRMAKYILQEYEIVRFPDEDRDIYIYNEKTGIYEIDKTCRQLRAIIRSLEFMKINQIREVQTFITDMSRVFRKESSEYVAVKNGLIHLETMEFKDFTPNVFVTKKIPTKYNPNAYDPFVEDTLQKVSQGHQPTIKNICEMFGAVLYPNLLVPKMFYLYGRNAHNGKSTILYTIQTTFNDGNNISAISPQRLAENTFAGSSIYGKLANIVDDQPDEVIKDSGTLKTMITGGYVEIEKKQKDSRTVQINTVFITASNHYPNFKEHGNQINKRLHILPFDHNFLDDPDSISERESMERLATDSAREYVLKLAAESIKEMLQRTGDVLTYNEKAEEAKENFAEYSDPLADFFFEYDKQYFEERRGTDTYKEYQDWCKDTHNHYALGYDRFKNAVCRRYDMEWKDKKVQINGNWKTVKGFKSKK